VRLASIVVDDPTERPFPPVSMTAIGVAAIRAAEANRPDPLFVDPLADAFVRAAGSIWSPRTAPVQRDRIAVVVAWVRVRTRFLDDLVLDACANGCRQVVTLGAGLDARAFRLAWPDRVRLFELDLTEVLAFKQHVVHSEGYEAACERIVVPTDLARDWTSDLREAGFDTAESTAWLAEGLLAYLTEESSDAVVDGVTECSVPGSRFGLTLASAERRPDAGADSASAPSEPGGYMALWQSEPPADAREWLAPRGWSVSVFDAYERAGSYGLPATATPKTRRHARLVDATRL
jgi:methyltransferase (TIGR00027 family)